MTKLNFTTTNLAFVVVYLVGAAFLWTGLSHLIASGHHARIHSWPLAVGFCILMTLSMAEWILHTLQPTKRD